METIKASILLRLQSEEKKISIQGKRIALIGPSGCGKSTLAKVLVGVSDKGSGSLMLGAKELMELPAWKRSIGYTPQDLILFPHLSVKENLLFPANAVLHEEILEELGIKHLLNRMPRHLSGGEKQRVALARSLSGRPELLVLDEPFSSLDFKTKDKVLEFVNQWTQKQNLPFIFISHNEKEIEKLGCSPIFF
jgi:molybdate transport system ATP-binding protein